MKKPILVPSLKVSFEDDFLHDTIQIIVRDSYADIFPVLMQTLVNKPHLFVDEDSIVQEKLSQTISGLEGISSILEHMQKDQTTMQKELADSIIIMRKMADEILIMKEQNSVQQKTLSETLDVLSSTQSGLEILKELKERSNINLQDIVEKGQAMQAVSNFDSLSKKINNDELQVAPAMFFPTVSNDEDDDDEEDLLGGISEEQHLAIISKFRQD